MKKLLKRIAPLLLALVLVLGSCLSVSAADNDREFWEYVLDSPFGRQLKSYIQNNFPDYKYIAVVTNGSNLYGSVYLSDCPFYDIYITDNHWNTIASYNNQNIECRYVVLSNSTPNFQDWSFDVSNQYSRKTTNVLISQYSDKSYVHMLSNYSLVKYGNESDYSCISSGYDSFFPAPPTPGPLVGAVQGAAPEEALKEVILLIPLSILFLAGCLGLRKGLRLLLALLHQA